MLVPMKSCIPLVLGAFLAAGVLVGMVPGARPLARRNANAQIFRLGGIFQQVAELIASYMPDGPNRFVMATICISWQAEHKPKPSGLGLGGG